MKNDVDFSLEDFLNGAGEVDGDPMDIIPPLKKKLVLFFLIDVSSSMKGDRIRAVNEAMRNVLPDLIGIGGTQTDVFVSVMEFSSGFEWLMSEPVLVERFQSWTDLYADGVTDLGMALNELNVKLSRKAFMQSPTVSYAPVIFLMTDGYPTDDYKGALKKLEKNDWFRIAVRVALAIGKDLDLEVLKEFTGNSEFIFQALDNQSLTNLVREISVTSSQISSQSARITEMDQEMTEELVDGSKKSQLSAELEGLRASNGINMADDISDDDYEEGW